MIMLNKSVYKDALAQRFQELRQNCLTLQLAMSVDEQGQPNAS